MTVELHGWRTGNSFRAAIALEEASISYVGRCVDLGRGEHRTPGYLALNPAGKVPTLVDRQGGSPSFVLSQSNAIVLHAAAQTTHLLPRHDGIDRSLVLERFFYFVTDVIAPSHAGFFLSSRTSQPGGAELLRARSCEAVAFAETFLNGGPFMAGRVFTIADIAAVTIVAHLETYLDWPMLPKLRTWLDETRARPAVERGFHAFDRTD